LEEEKGREEASSVERRASRREEGEMEGREGICLRLY
jgi:hypothetical protein